ncbi:hypothetical protein [Acinetobacter haemolyticus]|uniref:hypothetical protein n=1 Tax=Acinetobacter haemolyticus TaxID=29430 RepID=UPI000D688BD7|nr:hypothetical protein [Acinetobacter haemolyticus]
MDNYKIKVNDEAESKEAQELFFELGYKWNGSGKGYFHVTSGQILAYSTGVLFQMGNESGQELTLPQLRDLVVLKRNDVKDANYRDKQQKLIYLTSEKIIYYWDGEWSESAFNKSNGYAKFLANDLTPIERSQNKDLISGAEAKLAWAKGETVEFKHTNGEWYSIIGKTTLDVFDSYNEYRIKPRTIKLELEIPAPFDPREGEEAWCLDGNTLNGYKKIICDDFIDPDIGFWRTEEEIKQVVAALRGIKG